MTTQQKISNLVRYVLRGFRPPTFDYLSSPEDFSEIDPTSCVQLTVVTETPDEQWDAVNLILGGPLPVRGTLHPIKKTLRSTTLNTYSVSLPATVSQDRRSATLSFPVPKNSFMVGPIAVDITLADKTHRRILLARSASFSPNTKKTIRISTSSQ